MEIYNLYSGSWFANCYVLLSIKNDGKTHAAVVDPGESARKITAFLEARGAVLDMILLTHGHFDHIYSLDKLRDMTGASAYIHALDAEMLTDGSKNEFSRFSRRDLILRPAEKTFEDGDILTLGDEKIKVIHLPGHSRGSVALLSGNIMLTGDTLFDGSIGRSDLYGGDGLELYASLSRLAEFDPNITIYPGHGESAKLGDALAEFI